MEDESAARALTADLFRRESARILASLTRLLGPKYVTLAEDVVQDALLSALQAWRFEVPEDPRGWILKTAKHKAIDEIRRQSRLGRISSQLALDPTLAERVDAALSEDGDSRLAMMLSCCHEDILEETHVTLILRFLVGLSPREIAQAFLVETETIDRRIHRGRRRLEALGKLEDVRDPQRVLARLPSVLSAVYLLFNEGYHGSDEQNPLRASLCGEAIQLVDLLLGSPLSARPEVHALQALFCLNAARLPTRLDDDGAFVPLTDQDRSRWDSRLIARGVEHLAKSASGPKLTRWHAEAGLAAEHTLAPSVRETNWEKIVELYDVLLQISPGPVVELNRALAVAELRGLDAGRAALLAVGHDRRLAAYPFYWSALADIERRAGRNLEARAHYEKARAAARSRSERLAYERRLEALGDAPPSIGGISHEVRISRRVSSSTGHPHRAFLDGKVFALTGASSIASDGREGGGFELVFEGRGIVKGEYVEVTDERLRLSWNVTGFGRAPEATMVEVIVRKEGASTRIDLVHSGIGSEESATAKERAWAAVLAALDSFA